MTASYMAVECRACGRRRDFALDELMELSRTSNMTTLHELARDRLRCSCGARQPFWMMVHNEEAKELFGRPLPEGRRQDPAGPFYPGR